MVDVQPELYWDPFDTDLDTDPHAVWRRLRDEVPLYRNDTYDFWALSRWHDVEEASKDTATFSSARGTVLEMMGGDLRQTGQMIFMDPPEHDSLRKLVSRAFTPAGVAELEARIRARCGELLDPHVGGDGFDYLQDFGCALPSWVISTLLGVPEEDQERMRHVIDEIFHIEPGVGMVNETSMTASFTVHSYLADLIDDRVANPRDDMLTALVGAEVVEEDGTTRRLNRQEESATFGLLLFTAGTETVARLLGWTAVLLAEHPDQRAALAADPSLAPGAVEELLRYEAPSPVQGRWTTRDVELHGELVPEGSKVLLLTGAAGRDERAFPDADRFDVRRQGRHHVAFGYGIHFCLGASLARLEGRIAIEETLRRWPEWEVDHDRAERLHTSTVRGYRTVPIRV